MQNCLSKEEERMEKFTEYFDHDYYSRIDEKARKLRREMGLEGYGIFWCLIEIMYEQGGCIKTAEIPDIAYDLHIEEEKVIQVLTAFDLFKKEGDLYCSIRVYDKLQKRKEQAQKAREMGKKGAEKRWGKEEEKKKENSPPIATLPQKDSPPIAIREEKIREDNIYIRKQKPKGYLPKKPFSLILKDKTYFEITEELIQELKGLYKNKDIENELLKMQGWLLGNPQRRKTQSGIKRFITGWLGSEQEVKEVEKKKISQYTEKQWKAVLDNQNTWEL